MSNEQFEQLMEEIRQMQSKMQEKIDKLQKEFSVNQDKIAQTIVQKLKADKGYTFRKKGHEQLGLNWTSMSISRKHERKLLR